MRTARFHTAEQVRVYDPGWTQNLFGAGAILGVVLGLVGVALVLATADRAHPRRTPPPG